MAHSKPRAVNSEMIRWIDRPLNIIEFHTIQGPKRRSKYILNLEALQKLLEPIKNTEVVVIAVVGQSRRGKSFLLNYMCRYLSDYKNINGWVGDGEEPLGGFTWRSSSDPQTFGLWLSKPYIVKQSNGKEIAVLLMDTQGLFDDQYDQRDWSTIVGLSLLVSSCLIINVFTDISEDILSTLDSYINYGIKAAEVKGGSKESIPFQTLLFLIRDWNTPNDFRYGMTGGKKYLDKKLIVKESQSVGAQNVRKNMGKCFKDILCFLMPSFGDVMEKEDFNGSFNQLRDRFKEKLKEFISTLLNPEELVPKMIEDTPITGDELIQQFQTFIEIFNKEELPESQQILEAKAKLADNSLIRRLKDKHLDQLRASINEKPFVTRKELEERNNTYRSENIDEFEQKMKSKNTTLVDKLCNQLKKNYEIIFKDNEEKRAKYMEDRRDECGHQFMDALNTQLMNNSHIEPNDLEELFQSLKKRILDSLKESYGGEEEALFQNIYFELFFFLNNSESATRIANNHKIKEFDKLKEEFVGNVVDFYNEQMTKLLNDNIYLTKDHFKKSEGIVRNKTLNKFRKDYDFNNQSANEIFFLKVNQKLIESKSFFKEKNHDKCRDIVDRTEKVVRVAIERYENEMNEGLNIIQTIDDMEKLDRTHKLNLDKVMKEMHRALPFSAPFFINQYIDTFNREINKLFDGFKIQLTERNQKYVRALNEAKEHYDEEMTQSLETKGFLSSDELNKYHRNHRSSAIRLYESHFEGSTTSDKLFKNYLADLKDFIHESLYDFTEKNDQNKNSDERVIEVMLSQSLNTFNARMNELTQTANSDVELSNYFVALKDQIKRDISDNNTVSDKCLLNQKTYDFENQLDQTFDDFRTKWTDRKESVLKDYNKKVTESVDAYKRKMNQILEENEYITAEEFDDFHKTTLNRILSDLINQLKPVFDIEVNTFIDRSMELIGEEYLQYFVVNEAKRNNRWERIQNSSREFINQYERKINENSDQIQSEEELQTRHTQILDETLEECRKSVDFSDRKLISIQNTYIETEICRLFNQILANFREKMGIFRDTYEVLFQNSKEFYKNKMESLFEDNKFYPSEELNKYHLNFRAEALRHFQDQLKDNGLIDFKDIKNRYLDLLNDFMNESNADFLRKNEKQFEETLKEKTDIIKQKYLKTMNRAIDSMALNEADLDSKHYELMVELLEEFNDSIHLTDMTVLEPHQEKLQIFMKNELTVLQKKLNEKIDEIVKSYQNLSIILIPQFKQEMDTIANSEEIFSDEEFNGLHIVFSSDAISVFQNHLEENPCAVTQAHFLQFKQTIEEVYEKIKEKFQMKRDLKLKNLEIAINEFAQMYEGEMKDNLNNIKTIKKLKECHLAIKEKLIRNFEETHRFRDSTQMTPYLERLVENFDNSLIDFEDILELRIDKQEKLIKNLRLDIRRYYKEELQKFFQNKLFVQKPLLDKCHKLVMRQTIEKFSPEKEDLSEESFQELAEESVKDIFQKISDENEMKRPTKSQAIGIDLGTTNSCVAYFRPDTKNENNVVVIPNECGHLTTPSVVSYRDGSVVIVGQDAKDEIHSYPRNTISSVKRLIGRQYNDESVQNDMNLWSYRVVDDRENKPNVSIKVNGEDKHLHPEEVSAKVLRKMKEIAESHLGCEVTKAVITVPAYFNDGQKQATKDAGKLAGLEVLRIINEPTAAAIAFKVDRNEETEIRNVLIFDFGGGTFDVSILEINRGKIIVKAVGGDNHLGGDDIDTKVIKYCLEQFYIDHKIRVEGVEGEAAMCRLRNKCEKHKMKLTSVETTLISIDNFYQKIDLRVVLTRDKFEELNHHLFVKSIDLVKRTLEQKSINTSDIDDVVLVGGTTRIPKIQEMLSQFFGGKPLNHWVNPDEAVAKGAAIQAAYLNGQQLDKSTELELKDVTPLSLGIRIKGGKMSVIVPRNSPLPISLTKEYYTSEDNQTVVGIKIFEGEQEMADDNHLLGQFDLSGIPRAPQGDQPIDVTFNLNDEGILHVIAKIKSTGGENEVKITEHKGRLSKEMIERLIEEEYSNINRASCSH